MPLDSKISNILGVRIPVWLEDQINTRSEQNSKDNRNNDNLLYLANKTAWVRLVSSINITDSADIKYFQDLGVDSLSDEINSSSNIAKQFILFGGTSIYLNKKQTQLRSGFGKGGSYGMLGENEIQKYGYRPMPGITSVNIQTKGRLGSVREATINFRCYDKDQLDIIDALYFKLGYSMFLEWGQTYYYPSEGSPGNPAKYDPTKIRSTEFYAIDPFQEGLTKEEIMRKISRNSRDSEGNYDAMLGIVTNFNFSFTQDGAYDCTLRLAALGVLGDSIKINNPTNLPNILQASIKQYNNTLEEIAKAKAAKDKNDIKNQEELKKLRLNNIIFLLKNQDSNGIITKGKSKGVTYKELKNIYKITDEEEEEAIALISNKTLNQIINFSKYKLTNYSYPSNVKPNNINVANAKLQTDEYGNLFVLRRLNGYIPIEPDLLKTALFTLDSEVLENILDKNQIYLNDNGIWKTENETGIFDIIGAAFGDNLFGTLNQLSLGKSFTENYKTFVKNVPIVRIIDAASKLANPIEVGKLEVNETLQNTFFEIQKEYANEFDSKTLYKIKIKRKAFAKAKNSNATKKYTLISTDDFSKVRTANNETEDLGLLTYLKNNKITATELDILTLDRDGKNGVEIVFKFKIPFTKKSNIKVKKTSKSFGEQEDFEIIKDQDVVYELETEITIQDTYLIKNFTTFKKDGISINQPADFISYEENLKDQNQGTPTPDSGAPLQDAEPEVTQSPLSNLSTLELILRTIQIQSLTKAVNRSGVDINRRVEPIELAKDIDFINQIFSEGVFTDFIGQLIDGSIPDEDYDVSQNSDYIFKVQTKYGFATNLMANRQQLYDNSTTKNFTKVDYNTLLTTYVVPYNISQQIEEGTEVNHPVYISFGALLMILNHSCTIYSKNQDGSGQRPLVYIDFNPNHNFCLSHPSQLSTDPWTCLIPFEGVNKDYQDLFDQNIIEEENNAIKPLSDSTESIPLFTPRSDDEDNRDNLSGAILPFKYDSDTNGYRAKIMNILINIDYLMNTIKSYSTKDDQNRVYLKPFLEQIIIDIGKSLGNFNIFRLSYNDWGNTYQITDDQVIPTPASEDMLQLTGDKNPIIPLYGKNSIAKSLDIKSEVNTKLANMLAISANANTKKKSTLSNNGDYFGFVNTNYIDRYIPNREEPGNEQSDDNKKSESSSDGLKTTAAQFNSAIESFYNSIDPSQQSVGLATNYFINKITSIKGNDPPTRASAMIPVSLTFTTDGISGFNMGHAFTVAPELLPYTYATRRFFESDPDYLNKVGFVVVGASHTIENNVWTTAIKTNMIFLKDRSIYTVKEGREYSRQEFGSLSATTIPGISTNPGEDENGNFPVYEGGKEVRREPAELFQGKRVLKSTVARIKTLFDAAAKAGIKLQLESGYRTYDEQVALRRKHAPVGKENDNDFIINAPSRQFSPPTSRPGFSNHHNGVAIDISVTNFPKHFYWLRDNAEKYGFVRTVDVERWHWEYRPTWKKYGKVSENDPSWKNYG